MDVVKGREYTVKRKFSSRGSPASFAVPPSWTIYNSSDDIVQSGSASPSGSVWEASFTIPTNYIVPNGKEEMLLQFEGKDTGGKSYISDVDLVVEDSYEDFKPEGVVYNAITNDPVMDSVTVDAPQLLTMTVKVYDPVGNEVIAGAQSFTNVQPTASVSNGNVFEFTIPSLGIDRSTYNDPYQIVITYTSAYGTDVEVHSMHVLDRRILNYVQKIKQFLDKSRLVEIDESLQWHTWELIDSVLTGLKRINAAPPDNTFWTMKDFPSSMDYYEILAAEVAALDMRYMAEGMNAFEFSGLNSSLNYNRSEFLAGKISELNSLLEDKLPAAKKSAINVAGKGTPPAGESDIRKQNLGIVGLTINPLNNRVAPRAFRFR